MDHLATEGTRSAPACKKENRLTQTTFSCFSLGPNLLFEYLGPVYPTIPLVESPHICDRCGLVARFSTKQIKCALYFDVRAGAGSKLPFTPSDRVAGAVGSGELMESMRQAAEDTPSGAAKYVIGHVEQAARM